MVFAGVSPPVVPFCASLQGGWAWVLEIFFTEWPETVVWLSLSAALQAETISCGMVWLIKCSNATVKLEKVHFFYFKSARHNYINALASKTLIQ